MSIPPLPAAVQEWMCELMHAQQREAALLAGLSARFDPALLMRVEQKNWRTNPYVCSLVYSRSDNSEHARAVVAGAATDISALHAQPLPQETLDLSAGLAPLVLRLMLAALDDEYDPWRAGSREPSRWGIVLTMDALGYVRLCSEARARYRAKKGFNLHTAGAASGGVMNIRTHYDRVRHLLRQQAPRVDALPATQELLCAVAAGLALALLGDGSDPSRIKQLVSSRYELLPAANFLRQHKEQVL
jgi:hypothetical protein